MNVLLCALYGPQALFFICSLTTVPLSISNNDHNCDRGEYSISLTYTFNLLIYKFTLRTPGFFQIKTVATGLDELNIQLKVVFSKVLDRIDFS